MDLRINPVNREEKKGVAREQAAEIGEQYLDDQYCAQNSNRQQPIQISWQLIARVIIILNSKIVIIMTHPRAGIKRIKNKRIETQWQKLNKIDIPEIDWCDYSKLSPSDPRQRAWKYIFLFGSGYAPPPTTGKRLPMVDDEVQKFQYMDEEMDCPSPPLDPFEKTNPQISVSRGREITPGGEM